MKKTVLGWQYRLKNESIVNAIATSIKWSSFFKTRKEAIEEAKKIKSTVDLFKVIIEYDSDWKSS